MIRSWLLPALLTLAGLLVAGGRAADGDVVTGLVLLVFFLLLAAVGSPLVFPRSVGAAEALRRGASDGRPVVYWRPGCAFCVRLRFRLGRRARRAHWVNIRRDPEGAAAVRAANGGDETVPTVLLAGRHHTNPDPAWLRDRIDGLGEDAGPPR
ncbi:membrane protein [Streptomyces omiyaensis]|uniref:glutaredoxin domain-containing protein n=1 Tax=Streptomyces omiyaensis TaxID=68247 RepID=UPI001674D156|nr:glutaredoxin domain-containing protein [Streptomyces omiyaensis]GGY25063.1 membrane protein [Streptomyces omiyaensis]